jgi:hypothetical protein
MAQRKRNRNKRGGGGNKKKGGAPAKAQDPIAFWGQSDTLPEAKDKVRITTEPAAVVESLGRPPLPGQETIAEHYFEAVYREAVTVASALAAASGLPAEE